MFINDPDLRFAQERLENFRREADFSRIKSRHAPLWRWVLTAVRDRWSLARRDANVPCGALSECAP